MTAPRRLGPSFAMLLLLAWAPWAAGQIGRPLEDMLEAAALRLESGPEDGLAGARTEADAELELQVRGSALARVAGEGDFDADGIADAARVIAAATGYFEAIEDPVVEYLQQNLPLLAGRGPVRVAVGNYRLALEVTGDAEPFRVRWSISLYEVPEDAFLPARHAKGPADARYVIRDFSDMLCGFCARYSLQVLPALEEPLLGRDDVRFEFHHMVLGGPASVSARAAEATECVSDANADDPDAFWRFLDALFERQNAWSRLSDPDAYFVEVASELGLSADGVAACLDDGAHAGTVGASTERGFALGLTGTPTVFVGPYRLADYARLESYLEAMALIDAFTDDE